MHQAAVELLAVDQPTVEKCRSIAERLQQNLPASATLSLLDRVADQPTRMTFHTERLSLNTSLATCLSPSTTPSSGSEPAVSLATAVGLVDIRLEHRAPDTASTHTPSGRPHARLTCYGVPNRCTRGNSSSRR